MTPYKRHMKYQSRKQNWEELHIRVFTIAMGCYFMAHNLIKNGSLIQSNLTGKMSAELAMQLTEIAIDLRPDTGIIPIKKNGTKRSVKIQP